MQRNFIILAMTLLMALPVAPSYAQKPSAWQMRKYTVQHGGFLDITDKSIVEGSIDQGGLQPHYNVDYSAKEFKELRDYARSIRNEESLMKKADLLKQYINTKVLIHVEYKNEKYLQSLQDYRERNKNIPLSQYKINEAGVCREHALIYHQALKDAGVENSYVYIKAAQGAHVEDHAVNMVKYNGEWWVFDSYNDLFHRERLLDLQDGIFKRYSLVRIREIHNFPTVYIKKPTCNVMDYLKRLVMRGSDSYKQISAH